jgi:glycosyltransferase involved in cell wall biosynthesis
MRVLYLTDRLSHRGGAPRHLLDVIHALSESHEITVAAAAMDKEIELPTGVRFVKVPGLRAGVEQTRGLGKLASLLADSDIVHAQNVLNPTALEMAKCRPFIVTIQDHRVFCPGPGRTLPDGRACTSTMSMEQCEPCLPDTDHRERMLDITEKRRRALTSVPLLVLSTYMATELEQAGLPGAVILPPPVSVGPRRTDPGNGFLIAGRLVHHKGVDLAYRAWKMSNTQHPLRVAGLGSATEEMTEASMLGWLDRSALRTELQASRALLFPARWQEPFGIIGAEALAMGTPVVAMTTGGMTDWCEKGTITLQSGDIEGMAKAIKNLDENPVKALRIGHEGQQFIERMLDPPTLTNRLATIYQNLS